MGLFNIGASENLKCQVESTWSNNQEDPLFERLERILISPEWEVNYPLVTVRALNRNISDHAGLLIVYEAPRPKSTRPFRFELCWFIREGIYDLVAQIWNKRRPGLVGLDLWHSRFVDMRKGLKRWHFNYEGNIRKIKA